MSDFLKAALVLGGSLLIWAFTLGWVIFPTGWM